MPRIPAIRCSKQNLRAEIQHVRINRRIHQRQRPRAPVVASMRNRRRHLLILLGAEILPRHKSSEHHSRIERVRRHVSVLVARLHRPPIVKVQRAVLAAAGCRRWPTVLLRPVNPVRKLIVRSDVIKLSGCLVVPRAPRFSTIARYDRALIAAQNHPLRIVWINPQLVVIWASRIAFEHGEGLSSVLRLVDRSVRHIHNVRVFRINADFSEVPPSPPDTLVIRNALPLLSAVIRPVQPALLGIHDQVNPFRIARRKRDSDSPEAFRRQALSRHRLPVVSAVIRTIQPAAGPTRRRVDAPRRPSCLPQRSVNRSRISRLERQINRSRVLVVEQNLLPLLSSVFRTKNAALLVRSVRVSQRRHKNPVRVARIHQNSSNLP